MAGAAGPSTAESGLVFAYDTGNTLTSYIGEPTTNEYGSNFRDFTGTGYSPDGEWTSNPTRFTKTYYPNLLTPIGPGATLIEESGVDGFHHLSTYGGGSESGAHTLSCYLYPLVSGITEFCIGLLGDGGNMIIFNLDTRQVTYGGGITNGNAIIQDVPGWPGWIRVGANFEGRSGGWVGSVGYRQYTSYTGTSGGKKCYITGMQYEYKTHPTPFTSGTRSATQGLLDLGGSSSINLTNVSFTNDAQIIFDGTNDRIALTPTNYGITNQFTIEVVCYPTKEVNGMYNFVGSNGSDRGIMAHWPWSSDYGYLDITNTDGGFHRWYKVNAGILNVKAMYHFILNPNGQVVVKQNNQVMVPSGTTPFSGTVSLGVSNTIGAFYTDGSLAWGGSIYMFKIYKRALTDAETTENYEAVRDRFGI